MTREFQRLISKMSDVEGGKSQVKVGDMREVISKLAKVEAQHRLDGSAEATSPSATIDRLARIELKKLQKQQKVKN